MELYKGTICSITLVGTLHEAPFIYKLDDTTYVAEFFLTIYKPTSNPNDNQAEEQFFLYRVIVRNSEVMKIKNLDQFGIQLFVEGELQSYYVAQSSEKNLVIAEITANKLWVVNSAEFNQLKKEKSKTESSLFYKNAFDIYKSAYIH